MSDNPLFIEVDSFQRRKEGQRICGDAFYSRKVHEGKRVISVLSDGLGSGVKANILASMTSRMAARFVASNMDFIHSAEIMMDALPVCQVRKIGHATFTIIDTRPDGETRIIEMDNPSFVLLRQGKIVDVPFEQFSSPKHEERKLRFSRIDLQAEDRIIVYSDGLSQAGMGTPDYPLGWQESGCRAFLGQWLEKEPEVSARRLARLMINKAVSKEPRHQAQDDMTCGVLYFRRPRRLLVVSGPPFRKNWDKEIAHKLDTYNGKCVICGGTTATIIGLELKRDIKMDMDIQDRNLPPLSIMEGADLITEGILTLTSVVRALETEESSAAKGPCSQLLELFLESDIIEFIVGSRINEAHQDPSLPLDIEIRRNIVRRIARQLEEEHLKEVSIQCI